MPNWCQNSLTISNEDVSKIDALQNYIHDNKRAFDFLRPCQPSLESEEQTSHDEIVGIMPFWYEWNVENWGCKWDMELQDFERLDEYTLLINFDTAWSPPIALYEYLENLVDDGWTLNAMYNEPGVGFCGWYGEIDNFHVNESWSYDFDNFEESIKDIPEELREWANLDYEMEIVKDLNEEDKVLKQEWEDYNESGK